MTVGPVVVSSDPCSGVCVTVNVNASPSTSDPDSVIDFDSSSTVDADFASATGASLTAPTVIDTVAVALSGPSHGAAEQPSGSPRSVTLYSNESGPL